MSDTRPIIPIEERRIVPSEPTTLTVLLPNTFIESTTVLLQEIRDGFAFTARGVYCLEDGYLYCYEGSGELLSKESLALCQEMAKKIQKRSQ